MVNILNNIPLKINTVKVEHLLKGWSSDKKFYIEDDKGNKYLLRVNDISQKENKFNEYKSIKLCEKLKIKTSKAIEVGVSKDLKYVYILLKWVEGYDALEKIKEFNEKEQYKLGVKSGVILKKIHTIEPFEFKGTWEKRYEEKIERKIKLYKECGYKINEDLKMINFINNLKPYIKGRKQSFHHGDYHIGNLIITDNNNIGVIDFNRFDYGDPWEEFNRIFFSWRVSVPFAIGQIHGYFNNKVPEEFFRLLALYVCTNSLSAVSWAVPFGDKEINFMIENANNLVKWYDEFNTVVPVWYKGPKDMKLLYK